MLRFQRRHYIALAEIVQEMRTGSQAHLFGINEPAKLADKLVKLFGRDNPRFSRERFLEACGITAVPVPVKTVRRRKVATDPRGEPGATDMLMRRASPLTRAWND